jgi:putative membrane protein
MVSETAESPAIPWRRLHAASLWVNLVPKIWKTVRVLWPVLLAMLFTGTNDGSIWIDLVLLLIFFMVGLLRSIVHWATLRYRMDQGRLAIESGLLHRTSRIIDPQRIQNMERVQNLFHKMAGLAELRIETAGDRSTEGLLSAIHVHEAEDLMAQLKAASRPFETEDEETEESYPLLAAQSPIELVAYGLTNRGVGAIAILGVVAVEAIGVMGPEFAFRPTGTVHHLVFLISLLLLAFSASYALSILRSLHSHWRFRMTHEPGRLVTTEGLTTRRRMEIPLRKIQLVRTDEPLIRRWMGFGTLHIETAGLGFIEGEEPRAEGVIPMVEQGELPGLIRRAIPQIHLDPWSTRLHPAHFRALIRALGLRFFSTTLLVAIAAVFMQAWALVFFLLLIPSIPATWLDWKKQGWALDGQSIIARRGFFNQQTWLIPRDKLQSVIVAQTPGMRIHGLGQVVVRVAGAQIAMPEVAIERALSIFKELQREPVAAR